MGNPMRGVPAMERLLAGMTPEPNSGCWLWLGAPRGHMGYGEIQVKGERYPAHRLSYELHKGPIPSGSVVRHTCDTPACVNPDHLLVGTPADNSRDSVERGRQAMGARNARARLTRADVIDIRASGESSTDVARRYGVYRSTIEDIRAHRTWKHVRAKTRPYSTRPQTKLTEADVLMIRASTESNGKLARSLGVATATVQKARRGTAWKHVTVEVDER